MDGVERFESYDEVVFEKIIQKYTGGIAIYLNYMLVYWENEQSQKLIIENNLGDDAKVFSEGERSWRTKLDAIYKK